VDTVGESLADPDLHRFLERALFSEIMPTLDLPEAELASFASSVLERFANPFIRHEWLSIALNAVSKWKTRVLPSLQGYLVRKGELPACLSFSLAALIAFYRISMDVDGMATGTSPNGRYAVKDDAVVIETFVDAWAVCDGSAGSVHALVATLLANTHMWGVDLMEMAGLADLVTAHVVVDFGKRECVKPCVSCCQQ
jgi:tagaturonate reductase